jgi:DNA-binding beta-propeller fold protein YncE
MSLLITVVFLPGYFQEEDQVMLRVIVDSATVKVTPEIDGETLARIPLNTVLEALEKQGEWYKVSFDKEGLKIAGFIHEMLVREMSEDEAAEEAGLTVSESIESQSQIVREIEIRLEESRQAIRQEKKFKEALVSLSPLVAKTFRVDDIQKQRQLATEIFLWTGMAYSGLGDAYAALKEIRNMFEVDHAYGNTITRNIYDPKIGGLIEQAEKEYLGIIKDYSLRLSSQPERARVTINGEYIGETPLIYRSESPKVELEIERDGYRNQKDEMFLSQEDTDKEYVLERLGRDIELKSTPSGAKVFLDGEDTGQMTDVVLPYVSFGSHRIRLSKINYAEWEKAVEIPVGDDPISIDVILAGKNYVHFKKWGAPNAPIFQRPVGISIDNNGMFYVVDNSDIKIKKIDSDGRIDRNWSSKGKDFKNVKSPGGIAVDSQGNIFVTDERKHAVLKFDKNGTFIKKWGKEGNGNLEFNIPLGIAVDRQRNVYVADSANHCIKIYSNLGEFKKVIGKRGGTEGAFLFPTAIAINQENELFVLDRTRLQKFSLAGEFLDSWGSADSGDPPLKTPMGIFVDRDGFVYITDSGNDRIQKFDTEGKFISQWGTRGAGDNQLNYPSGIVVDSQGDIYVVERGNNRVQVFRLLSDDVNE